MVQIDHVTPKAGKVIICLFLFFFTYQHVKLGSHPFSVHKDMETLAITNTDLNRPCFAWHPYGKLGLCKTELVIVPCHADIRELSFFTGRGSSVCGGTRFFWGGQRGQFFFSVGKRAGQNFLMVKEEGLRQNLSLYHSSSHTICSYNQLFSQHTGHSLFNLITAPSIVRVMGMFFHLGRTTIFSRDKRGGPISLCMQRGGPEKIGEWPSQTDASPLLVKNDTSLNSRDLGSGV